jgi:hypothetical protein
MFTVRKPVPHVCPTPIRQATINEFLKFEPSTGLDEPTTEEYIKILEQLTSHAQRLETLENDVDTAAKISYIELLADAWEGAETPYSQVVNIEGITANSRVDLALSVEQLAVFWNKNLGFVTENENGVVTVYAIGQKPTNDYTVQVAVTEVGLDE